MQIIFEDDNWRIEKSTSDGSTLLKLTSKRHNPQPSVHAEIGHDGIYLRCPYLSRLSLSNIAVVGEV